MCLLCFFFSLQGVGIFNFSSVACAGPYCTHLYYHVLMYAVVDSIIINVCSVLLVRYSVPSSATAYNPQQFISPICYFFPTRFQLSRAFLLDFTICGELEKDEFREPQIRVWTQDFPRLLFCQVLAELSFVMIFIPPPLDLNSLPIMARPASVPKILSLQNTPFEVFSYR